MANRQAGAHLPPMEGSSIPQATTLLPLQSNTSQATALLSSGKGSSSSQATALPPGEASSISQATALFPGEGSSSSRATALLPGEASSVSQATALLPSEGSSSFQATALHPREASSISQATALLPGEGSSFSQAIAHLPPGEGSNSSQATAHLPHREGGSPPKQVIQIIKSGQSGKSIGGLLGIGHPRLPRRIVLSPGKTTSPLPPSRLPQGSSTEEPKLKWVINLSSKPLTPAQRSVLAKGPNFVVSPRQPPNLEYITAIEAACTKLSQQDAEELRADINMVLWSSHPLNLT